ncbi:hypothetical protein R1sor_002502, partial [Riccia sorocarpa]
VNPVAPTALILKAFESVLELQRPRDLSVIGEVPNCEIRSGVYSMGSPVDVCPMCGEKLKDCT